MAGGAANLAGAYRRAVAQVYDHLIKGCCIAPVGLKGVGGLKLDASHQRLHVRGENRSVLQFIEANSVVAQGAGDGKFEAELGF